MTVTIQSGDWSGTVTKEAVKLTAKTAPRPT